MPYIMREVYAGPNPEDHLNDDRWLIQLTPPKTNSSREVKLHGWLGTTNDWCRYAHGYFETASQAVEFLYQHTEGDLRPGPEPLSPADVHDGVLTVFLDGRYEILNKAQSADWAAPLLHEVQIEWTDKDCENWADILCEQALQEHQVWMNKEAIIELAQEHIEYLRGEFA